MLPSRNMLPPYPGHPSKEYVNLNNFKFEKCVLCGDSKHKNPDLRIHTFITPSPRFFERAIKWAQFAFTDTYWDSEKLYALHRSRNRLCTEHFADDAYRDCFRMVLSNEAIPTIITERCFPTKRSFRNDEHIDHIDHQYVKRNRPAILDHDYAKKPKTCTKEKKQSISVQKEMPLDDIHCEKQKTCTKEKTQSISVQKKMPLDDIHCEDNLVMKESISFPNTTHDVSLSNNASSHSLSESNTSSVAAVEHLATNKSILAEKPVASLEVKSLRKLSDEEVIILKATPGAEITRIPSNNVIINKKTCTDSQAPIKDFTLNPIKLDSKVKILNTNVLVPDKLSLKLERNIKRRRELYKKCLNLKKQLKRAQIKIKELSKLAVSSKLPVLPDIDRTEAIANSVAILAKEESKFCHACLTTDDLKPLHGYKSNLLHLFKVVTSVEITRGDLAYLCRPCLAIAQYMYKFKEQCLEIDTKFNEFRAPTVTPITELDLYNNDIVIHIQDFIAANPEIEQLVEPDKPKKKKRSKKVQNENQVDTTLNQTKNVLNGVINKWKFGRKTSTCLSLEKKVELIKEDEKKEVPRRKLAQRYGISYLALLKVLKNRKTIVTAVNNSKENISQRTRLPRSHAQKYKQLESLLYEYFSYDIENTSGVMWRQKAKSLADEMNIDSFCADTAWLRRFKKRFNINTPQNTEHELTF